MFYCYLFFKMQSRFYLLSKNTLVNLNGYQKNSFSRNKLFIWKFSVVTNRTNLSVNLFVTVFTLIHREGFICLEQLECQGTDQQCCVEDVSFVRQVLSSLLYPVQTLEAGEATTQLVCVTLSKHKAFIYHFQVSPSYCAIS